MGHHSKLRECLRLRVCEQWGWSVELVVAVAVAVYLVVVQAEARQKDFVVQVWE